MGPGADGAIEGPIGFSIGPMASLIHGSKASVDRGRLKSSQLRMHEESLGRRRPRDAVWTALRAFPQTQQVGFAPGPSAAGAIASLHFPP